TDTEDEASQAAPAAPESDESSSSGSRTDDDADADADPDVDADPDADADTGADAELHPAKAAARAADAAIRIRDRRLVRRLKAGNERDFQELVENYQDRIFGIIYRMMGNRQEAEDLAQEVFINVYRAIHNCRGEGKLYSWLYRIAS